MQKSNIMVSYTIIIEKDKESGWYTGQCQQVPEAISQGESLNELMKNMKEAIELSLETQKDEVLSKYSGRKIFRRRLSIKA